MAASSSNTYGAIIAEMKARVDHGQSSHCKCRDFVSRAEFTREARQMAKKHKEQDFDREFIRLNNSSSKIKYLAKAIGARNGNEILALDTIESAIWTLRYAVFEHGFRGRKSLKEIVDTVVALDSKLPNLPGAIEGVTLMPSLQAWLQKIVRRYFKAYTKIVSSLAHGEPTASELDTYFSKSKKRFDDAKARYDEGLSTILEYQSLANPQPTAPTFAMAVLIGQGSYGSVYKVQERSTGEFYAVKKIPTGPGESQRTRPQSVDAEIKIMKSLRHHHITALKWHTVDEGTYSLYIQPVADCNLRHWMDEFLKTPQASLDEKIFTWFGCLVAALKYAHACNIKHKDVKPENILIAEKGNSILLTDFGISHEFANTDSGLTSGPVIGTPAYLAPECEPDQARGPKVDVFALGCVFAEVLMVLNGTSPKDFDEKRLAETNGQDKSFRRCIDFVTNELSKAQTLRISRNSEAAEPLGLITLQTHRSLAKDPEARPDSADLFQGFHANGKLLMCRRCY